MIQRIPQSNWFAAALMALIGAVGAREAWKYPFEMDRIIGPAIFPLALSLLLILASAAILIEGALTANADEMKERIEPRWGAMLLISGGIIAFIVLVERFGMVPAIVASVMLTSLADRESTILRSLSVAVVLSVGCTLVFYTFLKLPLRPFIW